MQKTLPDTVKKYSESPLFNEQTIPAKLTSNHDLKAGVWGKICVVSGTLEYIIPGDPDEVHVIRDGEHIISKPEQVHFVRAVGQVEFKVEFYR